MRHYIGVAIVVFASGCVHSQPRPTPEEDYTPLKMPLEKIPLPSLFVSDGLTLSGGCLQPGNPTESASLSTLARDFVDHGDFEAGVKETFEGELVKAGVDASTAAKVANNLRIEASNVSVFTVDPATLLPNFNNPACTEPELQWFVNKRSIVVEGIRAAEMKITSQATDSSDVQAKLGATTSKVQSDFGTSFAHTTDQDNSVTMTASNVFFGVRAVPMVSKECRAEDLKLKEGTPKTICGGRYEVSVTPAPVGNRYTLSVTPKDGSTMDFDLEFGKQTPKPIGDLRIVYANVRRGTPMQANIGIILVGPSGTP